VASPVALPLLSVVPSMIDFANLQDRDARSHVDRPADAELAPLLALAASQDRNERAVLFRT